MTILSNIKKFVKGLNKDRFEDIPPGHRTQPWNETIEEPDYGFILRHSKEIRILNIKDLVELKKVKAFTLDTTPMTNIYIPYGEHAIGMKMNDKQYTYPYVIVSEGYNCDCRIFIFENIGYMLDWLNQLYAKKSIDIVTSEYLRHIRIVRQYTYYLNLFVKGCRFADIECDTSDWPELRGPLSEKIVKGVWNKQFDPFTDIKVELYKHNNFIKEWR